jgi:glutathione peroxidase
VNLWLNQPTKSRSGHFMKSLTILLLTLAVTVTSSAFAADTVHEFKMKSLQGKEIDLAEYRDKVLLIVNTASACGLTPQYEQLQAMHEEYKDKGLIVLGFPCNQFGQQEPGTAKEISEFCVENYGVKFAMFSKIDVNGKDQAALYEFLKAKAPLEEDGKKSAKNDIRWNFEKFVVGKDGKVSGRFSPRTKPDAEEVVTVIEKELAE